MTDERAESSGDTDREAAKRCWRSRLLAARCALAPPLRAAADAAIRQHVLDLIADCRHDADLRAVGLYAPVRGEVDVLPLVPALQATGWVTALPRVTGPGKMAFCAFARMDELVRGAYGIPEPPPGARVLPAAALAAVVVPGVGFAPDGRRLGYGGGYYDRWLAQPGLRALRIGVCYDVQRVSELPADPWDARMDYVVTEAGVWRCSDGV